MITKQLLEQEVEKYNKIVEELQKLSAHSQQLETARLKLFGKIEFIQESLQTQMDSDTKDISIDEVIAPAKKKSK